MNKLRIKLEHCYGIKKFSAEFDFIKRVNVIYAANGLMKSSLAETFNDVVLGRETTDRIFTERKSLREISGDKAALTKDDILVIKPLTVGNGQPSRVSTLLVNTVLRDKYTELNRNFEAQKEAMLAALVKESKAKLDWKNELMRVFPVQSAAFLDALKLAVGELSDFDSEEFVGIKYDALFKQGVIEFLAKTEVKGAIDDYLKQYDELVEKSRFLKKGVFSLHGVETVRKTLDKHGFFKAKHKIVFADSTEGIANADELTAQIEAEKRNILKQPALVSKFTVLTDMITQNETVRGFQDFLEASPHIVAELNDVEALKKKLVLTYLKRITPSPLDLLELHNSIAAEKLEIEKTAAAERTQWEKVIEIFNNRFFVPFKFSIQNRKSVVLGQDSVPSLVMIYTDGVKSKNVDSDQLLKILSAGELRAFNLLQIVFEIEVRKKLGHKTLFVLDDVADSFDYKNKYAIIEYIKNIAENADFRALVLTHNYDFFRTVASRLSIGECCYIATKADDEISLVPCNPTKNIFVKDWKQGFHSDELKMIASIPFIRNIVEYTNKSHASYSTLTNLLHWKQESLTTKNCDLRDIFNAQFNKTGPVLNEDAVVVERIMTLAERCASEALSNLGLESKVVLAMAIRLRAERYMIEKINDEEAVKQIRKNQTAKLFGMYCQKFGRENHEHDVLQRVILMTPEALHLNSFMYEPLIDLSPDHLQRLHNDVSKLDFEVAKL